MITEAQSVWLLAKTPSGDSSLRLHLLTRQHGIVSCFFKAGRTPKKQALLQPFLPLWLSFESRRDWQFARSIEASSAPLALSGRALFAALYVNELVFYAVKPFDPCPDLYDAYHYVLHGLSSMPEKLAMESLLRRFEWVLLASCGYQLTLRDTASWYRFVAGEGFVASAEGISAEIAHALVEGDFGQVGVLKTAKAVMRLAIDHLLSGRPLKSRQLFGQLHGN